jgi:hypothetical protein
LDWGTSGDNGEPGGRDDTFTVVYTTIDQVALDTEGVDEELTEQSTLPAKNDNAEVDNDINDNLDADHDDDASIHFRSINDILMMVGFAPRALVAEELHVVSSDELTSFVEVEHNPC